MNDELRCFGTNDKKNNCLPEQFLTYSLLFVLSLIIGVGDAGRYSHRVE